MRRRAFAPGRVNLIGEYTDIVDGHVLPIALDLGTTVELRVGGDEVILRSDDEPEAAQVGLRCAEPGQVTPRWARYVAAVVDEIGPDVGGHGTVSTTLPIGAGLSSSAALEVAVALAVGFDGSSADLARACQRAEQRASGVPCGVMDQLVSAVAVPGHAMLIDCASLVTSTVPWPDEVAIAVVDSGERRALAEGTAYADRRAACERAADRIGPLRHASLDDVACLDDPTERRRARHVVTEEARVHAMAAALGAADLVAAGEVLLAGHASLRDDFDVSTPRVDELIERLTAMPGVHGARLTGAGFGGSIVVLCEPGGVPADAIEVQPSSGAWVEVHP